MIQKKGQSDLFFLVTCYDINKYGGNMFFAHSHIKNGYFGILLFCIVAIIAAILWPFSIGVYLIWYIHKKTTLQPFVRYSLMIAIGAVALFAGNWWVGEFWAPAVPSPVRSTQIMPNNSTVGDTQSSGSDSANDAVTTTPSPVTTASPRPAILQPSVKLTIKTTIKNQSKTQSISNTLVPSALAAQDPRCKHHPPSNPGPCAQYYNLAEGTPTH